MLSSRFHAHFILLVSFFFLLSCASSSNEDDIQEVLTLDVRVHLLESPESPGLTTTLDEDDVRAVFDGVNEIWEQAAIVWNIESIITETAFNGANFERVLRNEIPGTFEIVSSVIPRANLTNGRWDVFLIRDLGGGVGGLYFPGIPAVLQPEIDPNGISGLEGGLVRILSHELGHSLSLQHVACTSQGNLLAPGCVQGVRTRLTEGQIEAARRQASSNRPF